MIGIFLSSQWRNDYLNGLVKFSSSHETQEECLGLAVLDMTRSAKEKQLSPLDIYHSIRYLELLLWVLSVSLLLIDFTHVVHQ